MNHATSSLAQQSTARNAAGVVAAVNHVTTGIARLSAATARAAKHQPDVIETDHIYDWVRSLSHAQRIAELQRLGERTDDLWVGHVLPGSKVVSP